MFKWVLGFYRSRHDPLMAGAAVGLYKSTGDMFYWEVDTHFNHIGHDFVGKKIDSAFFKINTP